MAGLRALFRQFSFSGGIPSHVAPETPGSIHEGGELGYTAAHTMQVVRDRLIEHEQYIITHGQDMPEIRDWKWPY
jgi:phosphoketolase